jgi:hypothetical protein
MTIEITHIFLILTLIFLPQIHLFLIIMIFECGQHFHKIINFITNVCIWFILFSIINDALRHLLE